MGYSVKAIPFFTDDIELDVHTATYPEHLGHTSIRDFCAGEACSLEQVEETGEYIVRKAGQVFMQGAEI